MKPLSTRSGCLTPAAMMTGDAEPITVLTPVYLDRPERWEYLVLTLGSFYRCCRYPGVFRHALVDDRSPLFAKELAGLCAAFGIRQLEPVRPATRRGFFEPYRRLLASADTRFFLYLEPD